MKTKKELTEVVLIVDESGSMYSLKKQTVDSLNSFIEEQKSIEGMARLSILFFNSNNPNRYHYKNINIQECYGIDYDSYKPISGTPLYDAVGLTIMDVDAFNKKCKGRAVKTKKATKFVVCIVTDGEENDSKEYNKDKISELIKEKESEGWHFVYLSANADAFLNAEAMGINTKSKNNITQNYDPTQAGLQVAYCSISESVRGVRTGKGL